jgi:Lsr2
MRPALSSTNAQTFRKQLTPFIEHARKAGRALARRAARTTASRQRHGGIPAWSTDHGIAISERGRDRGQDGEAVPSRCQGC